MTARDVLAEIEQRSDLNAAAIGNLRSLANHAKPNREAGQGDKLVDRDRASALRCAEDLRAARTDVPRLVAALRAVLDHADKIDHPSHYENTEREETCVECHKRNPFRGGAYWPCAQRKHAESIRTAITDALNGVTAGTDR